MSEGVFGLPRVADTTDPNSCKQLAQATAFGTAGVSVSAKGGRLYKLSVVNSSATRYFVQVFDKATAPTAGNTPVWEASMPANGDCQIDFGLFGLSVTNGIGIAISSTKGTLTLAAATDASAYGLYTVKTV